MNIDLTDEELAFRDEVRAFFQNELPPQVKEKIQRGLRISREDQIAYQQALYAKGWAGANWPEEYGGTGWSATQKYIFNNEAAAARAPRIIPFGLTMVAPVIYTFGNEEQKQRFLPDILASKVWWCQGYSEPNAGSDLAGLKTRAVRDGDHYIVNGTKTWTTLGHYADWIFCLVRTSDTGKKQEGISFLLIDMNSPGVSVTPIITLDGRREVNEVNFDEVRVPVENLVGEEGKGWTYAKVLLTHERTNIAGVATSKQRLERLRNMLAEPPAGMPSLVDNSVYMARVMETEIELKALEFTELRVLSAVATGKAPGPESSILKIKGTEVQQMIDELYLEAAGHYALPFVPEQYEEGGEANMIEPHFAPDTAPHYYNNRKVTIFGGTNEIQKNIIAKAVLEL
ncbi:pimeloyl-CoA dehydrogenase large subunit [Halomonas eurihalina]|uniref:Pimeloyl-CoA dehydrogenase large subunit n=1 Tax=Halomonas eurihalina TaxID=42566 RepID=A0A5D9CMD0_HALER|nr:acyl-CoA dehydrogenase family protein [Halomonas eurihalina]MDR5861224.1 acyl-CoA dehydrogenase family protein [Halomonas eurihalina]TZG32597.1 pimeloyl-CoA dehydrogenase large subunit [Halomonas eurihalina]